MPLNDIQLAQEAWIGDLIIWNKHNKTNFSKTYHYQFFLKTDSADDESLVNWNKKNVVWHKTCSWLMG